MNLPPERRFRIARLILADYHSSLKLSPEQWQEFLESGPDADLTFTVPYSPSMRYWDEGFAHDVALKVSGGVGKGYPARLQGYEHAGNNQVRVTLQKRVDEPLGKKIVRNPMGPRKVEYPELDWDQVPWHPHETPHGHGLIVSEEGEGGRRKFHRMMNSLHREGGNSHLEAYRSTGRDPLSFQTGTWNALRRAPLLTYASEYRKRGFSGVGNNGIRFPQPYPGPWGSPHSAPWGAGGEDPGVSWRRALETHDYHPTGPLKLHYVGPLPAPEESDESR